MTNRHNGIIEDVRSHNIGESDYAKHKIQVWDIILCYSLNLSNTGFNQSYYAMCVYLNSR